MVSAPGVCLPLGAAEKIDREEAIAAMATEAGGGGASGGGSGALSRRTATKTLKRMKVLTARGRSKRWASGGRAGGGRPRRGRTEDEGDEEERREHI